MKRTILTLATIGLYLSANAQAQQAQALAIPNPDSTVITTITNFYDELHRTQGIQEHGHRVDTDFGNANDARAQLAATLLHADADVDPVLVQAKEGHRSGDAECLIRQVIYS